MKSHSLVQPGSDIGVCVTTSFKGNTNKVWEFIVASVCVWGGGGGLGGGLCTIWMTTGQLCLGQLKPGICSCRRLWGYVYVCVGGGGESRMWDSVQYRCFCIVWMCWCNSRSTWHHCCGKQCGPGASAGTDQQTSLAGESLCWFVFHYINFVQERK